MLLKINVLSWRDSMLTQQMYCLQGQNLAICHLEDPSSFDNCIFHCKLIYWILVYVAISFCELREYKSPPGRWFHSVLTIKIRLLSLQG